MNLENYINEKKKSKDILLMSHQILGYPSFEENERVIELFAKNKVDLVELQIPFSDPVADGPTFMKANQTAVENGIKVGQCLEFMAKMVKKHEEIPFLFMTYFNIIYKYGIEKFAQKCMKIGVKGLIVPDAPIDDANEFFAICTKNGIDAVGLATAYTKNDRMAEISHKCGGFIYYVPRKGVTGQKTKFGDDVLDRIKEVGALVDKNIAVGFGISSRSDVQKLVGAADIAIIGSKILNVLENDGLQAVDEFLKNLR